jgi:hypothetical protein
VGQLPGGVGLAVEALAHLDGSLRVEVRVRPDGLERSGAVKTGIQVEILRSVLAVLAED